MGRNKINFVDLCQGEFGRKIAYTGVDQITPQNVAQVLSDTIGIPPKPLIPDSVTAPFCILKYCLEE